MKHTISEILLNTELENAIVEENRLLKDVVEDLYPELDFSDYNVELKDDKETVDDFALYNELLKHDQDFRDKVIENIDNYSHYGFVADDEFLDKVWVISEAIENNLEELVELECLNDHKCFEYSQELMDLSSGYKYSKRKSNQKKRIENYKRLNK